MGDIDWPSASLRLCVHLRGLNSVPGLVFMPFGPYQAFLKNKLVFQKVLEIGSGPKAREEPLILSSVGTKPQGFPKPPSHWSLSSRETLTLKSFLPEGFPSVTVSFHPLSFHGLPLARICGLS